MDYLERTVSWKPSDEGVTKMKVLLTMKKQLRCQVCQTYSLPVCTDPPWYSRAWLQTCFDKK